MPIVHGTQTGGAGLAYGLNGVTDWTVQQAFLDVFKTARTWHGHTESQWAPTGLRIWSEWVFWTTRAG